VNVRLEVEYDGTAFCGFQVQANVRTVQGELEKAVERLAGEKVRVIGAGRTDAGVHAAGQVVNFHASLRMPPAEVMRALNALLPYDVAVSEATKVPEEFHARFSARSRLYRYWILTGDIRSALLARYTLHKSVPLNLEAMQDASAYLIGRQDFASFAGMGRGVPENADGGTVRTVLQTRLERAQMPTLFGMQAQLIALQVEADAFLPQMVRNIVGTLLDVGTGKLSTEEFRHVVQARDRRAASATAPAQGLCLIKVNY
jgi:tRNA pseudouridine38-40 synthase